MFIVFVFFCAFLFFFFFFVYFAFFACSPALASMLIFVGISLRRCLLFLLFCFFFVFFFITAFFAAFFAVFFFSSVAFNISPSCSAFSLFFGFCLRPLWP